MRAYFILWSPEEVFSPILGPNFYVYAPIFKIRSSKLVRIVSENDQDIKKCSRVYILAVIGNCILLDPYYPRGLSYLFWYGILLTQIMRVKNKFV